MIVVGVDESEASKEALRVALHEAKLRGTRLRAVHAWNVAPIAPVTGPGMVAEIDMDALRRAASKTLQSIVESIAGGTGDGVEQVLVEGPAAQALLAQAEDAELIVVGSHGKGALAELILGSTCHHIVHHARTPVLVVPGPED